MIMTTCPGPVYAHARDDLLYVLCDGCDFKVNLGHSGAPLNGFEKLQHLHDHDRLNIRKRTRNDRAA